MPFRLIKGFFRVTNYSPDGDSIRFEPDDAAHLHALGGFKPKINSRNHAQLRVEAIDALETHYSPPSGGGVYHQPTDLALEAAEALMDFVGVTAVVWDAARKTVLSANDNARGYILARDVEKNGRPIAFVFAGEATEADGEEVMLDATRVRDSYNRWALAAGLAYPTFYRGLFHDLRIELTSAVQAARAANAGVYAIDASTSGFDATGLKVITEDVAILPKLFRRLTEFMVFEGTAEGFKAKLGLSQEPLLDLTNSNFTHFDNIVEQADGSTFIKLSRRPEDLVFDEMKTRPPEAFSALMGRTADLPPPVTAALLRSVPMDYSTW